MKWLVKRPVTEREIINSKSKRRREKSTQTTKKLNTKKYIFTNKDENSFFVCVYIYRHTNDTGIQYQQ